MKLNNYRFIASIAILLPYICVALAPFDYHTLTDSQNWPTTCIAKFQATRLVNTIENCDEWNGIVTTEINEQEMHNNINEQTFL